MHPAAAVTTGDHHGSETSVCRDGEQGSAGQSEGERVETSAWPRNGESPQAFVVGQLITAGKAIRRPCESFASVYPGTWGSGWGLHAAPQHPEHSNPAAEPVCSSGTARPRPLVLMLLWMKSLLSPLSHEGDQ